MPNYRKVETALRVALDLLSSARGVSLQDIGRNYSDKPASRRTAQRYRNSLKPVFPTSKRSIPIIIQDGGACRRTPLVDWQKISSRDWNRLAYAAARLRRLKAWTASELGQCDAINILNSR